MPKVYRGKDAKILIRGTEVGRAQSASVEIATNPETLWEIGSYLPTDVVLGNMEITGSIEKVTMDIPRFQLLSLAVPSGSPPTLTEFDLVFRVGTEAGAPLVSLTGCVVETGSLEIPVDGWISEAIDFRAKNITLTTV